jgi:hypothetical protein
LIGVLQPLQDHGSIQPTGVGQDCFFNIAH